MTSSEYAKSTCPNMAAYCPALIFMSVSGTFSSAYNAGHRKYIIIKNKLGFDIINITFLMAKNVILLVVRKVKVQGIYGNLF